MSERLNMPVESWRPQRRDSVLDTQMLRMAVLAGGVAAVLGFGYGGYALLNRGPHTVPVIEADSRPVRVRPDNPGGMQVPGAEEQIMSGDESSQADVMAPPPEVPQLQALRAQIQAEHPPAPAVAPAPATSLAQPVSLPTSPPAPPPPVISAAPEQRPATLAASPRTPVAAHATAPAVASGGGLVQLAAMDSEPLAKAEWQRLVKKMPALLASHHPDVVRTERDGKTFFRLRTGGFSDTASATSFCTEVKAKGGGCSIAGF